MNNQKKNNDIKEAIINTIAFFDIFEYPLTAFEVWIYLPFKCDYFKIEGVLKNGINHIGKKNGFYFLKGRLEVVNTKLERYNITDRKFKIALRIAKLFKIIPWIKMIAVGNIIGSDNLRDRSDIDLFIVTDKKRIWITRFFCVIFVKFLGVRPKINDTRDKICLSFFVSEDNLNLDCLRLKKPSHCEGKSDNLNDGFDTYFTYWLAGLTPIFDIGGVYDKLIEENGWLASNLPNWKRKIVVSKRDSGKPFSFVYKNTIDLFIGELETKFKKYQLKILPRDIKELMNIDNRVVVGDKILKFHVNDRRKEFLNKYEKLISNFK